MARKHSSSSDSATAGRARPAAAPGSNDRTSRPGAARTAAGSAALVVAEPDIGRPVGIRSTLTKKSQTTVPRGVRHALHVGPGDELEYEIRGDQALLRRADATEDPVLLAFLDLLERDLACHPEHARPLPAALLGRMRAIAEATARISRDEVIDGAVAL